MTRQTTRLTLSVPEDLARRAERLRQAQPRQIPCAEMYRRLILLGIQCVQERPCLGPVRGGKGGGRP